MLILALNVRRPVPRNASAINLKADKVLRDGKSLAIRVFGSVGVDGATDDDENIENSRIIFFICSIKKKGIHRNQNLHRGGVFQKGDFLFVFRAFLP
jgi:hypothetical protein